MLLLQAGIYTRPQVLRVLTLRRQLQELQALLAEQEVRGQTPGRKTSCLLALMSGCSMRGSSERTSASPCCPSQGFRVETRAPQAGCSVQAPVAQAWPSHQALRTMGASQAVGLASTGVCRCIAHSMLD